VIRVWTAALTLVVAGALAGCGDDDAAEPEAPVTVTTTVTSDPTPTETTSAPPETETAAPTETSTPAPPIDLSQPPTTYEEAEAHVAAALESTGSAQELRTFQSANERFYCSFGDEFIPPSCEILDAIRDPETCADSPSPNVGRIELTRKGWAPFCNTDTIRQPGASILVAGGVATWPALSVECALEDVGLTCLQTDSQQGFFLGTGRYEVF
jgi:hypothetical protein